MSYYVRPRYTPGSPSMVSRETAERVAREEKSAMADALEGLQGAEQKRRAEALGLHGVAELRTEANNGWRVRDLITGAEFFLTEKQAALMADLRRSEEYGVVVVNRRWTYFDNGAGLSKLKDGFKEVCELVKNYRLRLASKDGTEERFVPWDRWAQEGVSV